MKGIIYIIEEQNRFEKMRGQSLQVIYRKWDEEFGLGIKVNQCYLGLREEIRFECGEWYQIG